LDIAAIRVRLLMTSQGLIESQELKPGIKECRTLAELRHTSLPRLIGGEIRANEATGTSQVFVT